MNLTEHLEYIIGLIDKPATLPEIKSACLAMHEEAAGQTKATEEKLALLQQYQDAVTKNAELTATIKELQTKDSESQRRAFKKLADQAHKNWHSHDLDQNA